MQNEYLEGPIAVTGAEGAIAEAAALLAAARDSGAPIIHVAHRGREGGLFDRTADRGQIVAALAPQSGETVIEKQLPNAFAGTNLKDQITANGRDNLVLCGFMTHMCVSSTARAALDHGLRITVAASACATRVLPDGRGGSLPAETVHTIALAELRDRFGVVANSAQDVI